MKNLRKLVLATLFVGLSSSAFAQNIVIHPNHDRNYRHNERIIKPVPISHYDRKHFRREHEKVNRMLRQHRITRQEAFRMHQRLDRQERQQHHRR